ncbi:MAG: hypothetical protein IT518_11140 [Burkholderiales bacterium]|nr:hypothetical protein [Burkholderiales bacterium]
MSDLTPGAWLGIALFAAYAIWLWAFFTHLRPRLARALGRRLNVRVRESHDVVDAGTWDTDDEAPIRKTVAVLAVDLAVLLLGTVGVATLVFVPAFIVAESGVLLALEGRMTGRQVTLRAAGPATMQGGKASLVVEVANEGRGALAQCRATVEGYSARNGYLTGASPWFDLGAASRRSVTLVLDARRPPAGEHTIRVKVECANERLAVGDALVVVRY